MEETGGGGADGGIDLKLFRDGRTTIVQCKHWKTWKVNVKPVRELFGVMTAEGADSAIFITSGGYTSDALKFAEGKPIELIDQHGFLDLVRCFQKELQDHYGVEPVNAYTNEEMPAAAKIPPNCPMCQSPMKLRTAKRGKNAGSQFWGCSRFSRLPRHFKSSELAPICYSVHQRPARIARLHRHADLKIARVIPRAGQRRDFPLAAWARTSFCW